MSTFLKILRWFFSSLLILGLFVLIITGIPSSAVITQITNNENLKNWLSQSGLYENALDIVSETLKTQGEGDNEYVNDMVDSFTKEGSETNDYLNNKFSSEFLEESANTIIDSSYEWAEAKTEVPNFEIEIFETNEEVTEFLTIGFKEKLTNLPACEAGYVPPADFNPLEIDCIPAGFTEEEIETFINANSDIPNLQELTEKLTLNADTFNITSETTESVQTTFGILRSIPKIIIIALSVLSLLLVVLIPGWKKGFLITGIVIALGTICVLVGTFFINKQYELLNNLILDNLPSDQANILKNYISRAIDAVRTDMVKEINIWSLAFLGVGILLIIISIVISVLKKKKEPKNQPQTQKTEPEKIEKPQKARPIVN